MRGRGTRVLLFVTSLSLAPAPATAAEAAGAPLRFGTRELPRAPGAASKPSAPPLADVPTRSRWYGWQTLLADGAAIEGALAISWASGESTLGAVAFFAGVYALGAPAVHLVNGNPGRAAGSFGLRLAAPTIGGLVGSSMGSCERFGGCSSQVYMVSGVVLGYLSAVVVDATVIARERVPLRSRWSPTIVASEEGAVVGLHGTW
jgi:hypothetical protein